MFSWNRKGNSFFTCSKSEMSCLSRGWKLSISVGASKLFWTLLWNDFLLNAASTSSGFIPALRHLPSNIFVSNLAQILLWCWPIKPAPLTRPATRPVNVTVPRPLHTAIGFANASSEESSAGVTCHCSVMQMWCRGSTADAADGCQAPLRLLEMIDCMP